MFCVQLSKPRDNFIEQKMHLLHCICAILFYQSMYNIICVDVHSRYAPKQSLKTTLWVLAEITYYLLRAMEFRGEIFFPSDFPTDSMYVSQPF